MATCEHDSSCAQCDSSQACSQQDQERHAEERLQTQLHRIKHTIMVMSGKGGVGKSTVAANLAVTLSRRNHRVGLMDADIHGPNIPKMMGLEEGQLISTHAGIMPIMYSENLMVMSVAFMLGKNDEAVIWRGPLKHSLSRQFLSDIAWGDLDYLVVDLPPGTGDEPLSVAHTITNVDGAIIVTTPQSVAVQDARRTVTFARKLNIPVRGIVENMSGFICPHCGERTDIFKIGGGRSAANMLNVPFLGEIPLDPNVVILSDDGSPYVEKHPSTAISEAFENIAKECEQW
ncbi:MAG: Mrp/NBP35 family ATP-binding protein [Smithellaceae bacterium]